jgi:hypothetical protein
VVPERSVIQDLLHISRRILHQSQITWGRSPSFSEALAEVDGTPSLVIHKDSQGANFADSMTGYLKL